MVRKINNVRVTNKEQKFHNRNNCSFLLNSDFNSAILTEYTPLSKNPEVLSAVDKISDLVSSMTIHLRENGENGDKRIQNNLSKMIDISPNKWMTRKTFIYVLVKEMLLTGNSVALPIYENGYIENLIPLASSNISFIPDGYGYYAIINGKNFYGDEILHFLINPQQPYPWKGNSYEISLKTVVSNLSQAAETKKGFLKSKWKPSLIIKADALVDGFGNNINRSLILNDYIKTSEAGEPWLIPSETFEVQEVRPLSLNDLAINDSVNIDKKTVAAILGVPEFLVGVGAFNKEEWNNFISTKIKPICNIFEQEITKKLIVNPNWYIRFNSRSLYNYDISTLSSVGTDLYTRGIMTGNEVRDWTGQDPLEGLDELVILENYIPLGTIANQKKLNGGGEDNGNENVEY